MDPVVWKFIVDPSGQTDMPRGATILHVAGQGDDVDDVCVWALCDPAAPREPRFLAVVPTGAPPPTGADHLGTALLYGGNFVGHVFGDRDG